MYIAGDKRAVDTGDTYFNEIRVLPISASKTAKDKLGERTRILARQVYDYKPLDARIEYGRWIVDCPNCGNAEFAFEDKLFFCSLCHNSNINGQVRKVKMPKERTGIENVLGTRCIVNRHWKDTETIKDLESENTKMGVI